ncbi:hypothetical protein FA13DRAFT_1741879 [Coprinellus micaceus]|uniref:Uncharacterized protein n=1 Tax=Coprinellus micaceus TaxID=71717 RepID=A0A4Y7SI94_COPMI|nr:hypothetical protein FA13DRAFT_1741879 [Coprinellus micaceus]
MVLQVRLESNTTLHLAEVGERSSLRRKTEKKKASFTRHNVKQAQKFGNKSAQKTSKAAKQKAQRKENWDEAHPRKKDDSSANQGLGWTWAVHMAFVSLCMEDNDGVYVWFICCGSRSKAP